MKVLEEIAGWPVKTAAAGVTDPSETLATYGDLQWPTRIASISKTFAGYAGMIAVEEGSITLDQPAGPPESTVRHLLAHASGLPFEGRVPIAPPGRRRIYSNTGIEVFADALASSCGMTAGHYLHEGIFGPLGMTNSVLRSSLAYSIRSTVEDLLRYARELLSPTLITGESLREATSPQFPELAGVTPGLGRYDPNPWGLGFELKGAKNPHWTAPDGSPRTFGHFGGSGTFLWVDPDARLACVVLTDREFGDWARPRWSALSQSVLAALS